jgi:formylglycine-generating enzyme required for sulfatase activity
VKILFFSANAIRGKPLAIDQEYRAIEQSLRMSPHGRAFVLIPKLAAQDGDLQRALMDHEPDIVHFACHGSAEAELLLFSEEGGVAAVPAEALTSMFRVLRGRLALVVLNACWSREQASAIRESAGLCVGMREPIGDAEAIKFAAGFYGALGYGRSVRDAFELGVVAVKAKTLEQGSIPQLFEAAGCHAHKVVFARDARRAWARWTAAALCALAACTGLALLGGAWASRRPEPSWERVGSSWEMVRFRGGVIQPAVIELSPQPASCASDQTIQECEGSGLSPAEVASFELDRDEVTNRAFAGWLATQAEAWRISKYGVVETRGATAVPLARIAPECGGGLTATAEGHVRAGADKGHLPVVCVTWQGASDYCRAQDKRLPLEQEWELAARGREGRPFPWGDDLPRHDGVTFDRGDGAMRQPREVGTSRQDVTPQGVRDLGGNVAEWVEDGRGEAAHETMRGGTWASRGPCHLLGARCKRLPAASYQADVGFRCARSATSSAIDDGEALP